MFCRHYKRNIQAGAAPADHYCHLEEGHTNDHECNCGVRWENKVVEVKKKFAGCAMVPEKSATHLVTTDHAPIV